MMVSEPYTPHNPLSIPDFPAPESSTAVVQTMLQQKFIVAGKSFQTVRHIINGGLKGGERVGKRNDPEQGRRHFDEVV